MGLKNSEPILEVLSPTHNIELVDQEIDGCMETFRFNYSFVLGIRVFIIL